MKASVNDYIQAYIIEQVRLVTRPLTSVWSGGALI